MSFTARSSIETRRVRRFGRESKVRFLQDSSDGFVMLTTLDSHFFLVRKKNTETGDLEVSLIFDEAANLDVSDFAELEIYVDLSLSGDFTDFERFKTQTETKPFNREKRWFLKLTAEFGNKTPIVEQ